MANNEIIFPKEPEMKITDEKSPLYSQYITDMYDSVGYYDEPKLLKLRELIKLILAVEWLYKEKGIRMNKKWIRYHTSKDASYLDLSTMKEPPTKMIPRPPVFKAPSSDVAVYNSRLGVYKACVKKHMGERRWGYYDRKTASVISFKGDGTRCPSQKFRSAGPPEEALSEAKRITELLPMKLHQYAAQFLTAVAGESEFELESHPSRELAISQLTTTIATDCKLLTNAWPIIPGIDEADVKSREKLIADWTVPIPCVFAQGEWQPSCMGGVSTYDIPVEEQPMHAMPAHKEAAWKGNYKRRGHQLVVRAEEQGMFSSTSSHHRFYIVQLMLS
jgi:hypothetical protein